MKQIFLQGIALFAVQLLLSLRLKQVEKLSHAVRPCLAKVYHLLWMLLFVLQMLISLDSNIVHHLNNASCSSTREFKKKATQTWRRTWHSTRFYRRGGGLWPRQNTLLVPKRGNHCRIDQTWFGYEKSDSHLLLPTQKSCQTAWRESTDDDHKNTVLKTKTKT